jgi:hypothetical protein
MPRFYFYIRRGPLVYLDEHGQEFGSLDAAESEAASLAREIEDNSRLSDVWDVTVEVRNERRQTVLTITVAMYDRRVTLSTRA